MTNYEKCTNCFNRYFTVGNSCDSEKTIYSESPFKVCLDRTSFDEKLLQSFRDMTSGKIVEKFENCLCSRNKKIFQNTENVQRDYLSGLLTENSHLTKIKY